MFSRVLDCPECKYRFNFDNEGGFPEVIECPNCNKSRPCSEYSALVLCHQCRQKLRVPLNLIGEKGLSCPLCSSPVGENDILSNDEDIYTYSGGTEQLVAEKRKMLRDGDFFDNYKIVRFIGRGGMAEVYLAEHLLLRSNCAIKVMRNVDKDDPIFAKRFIREAKLSHRLEHDNIIKVFDAGCDFKTGYMYISMEYVNGSTLLEVSNGKTWSEKELTDLLCAMAEALKVLHRNNVVHRDIKPSNIMLTVDGTYKLMDLGIAKSDTDRAAGEMTLTMDRQTIGTPSYASPEQCKSAHQADIRSDIYSLGATLYHLASGVVPYDGTSTVEIILKVMNHDLVPLKNLRGDLSKDLLAMIDMMMRTNPDERPPDPDDLLDFVYHRGRYAGDRKKLFFENNFMSVYKPAIGKVQKILPRRKIIKHVVVYTVGLFLSLALLIGLFYVYGRYKERTKNQVFVAEVSPSELQGKKEEPRNGSGKNRQEKVFYPKLMKYPDPDGRYPAYVHGRKNVMLQVKFTGDAEQGNIFSHDFSQGVPNKNLFAGAEIRNGAVCLSGNTAAGSADNRISNSVFLQRPIDNFTVSLTFAVADSADRVIFAMQGNKAVYAAQMNKELCIFVRNHRVATGIKLEPDEKINLRVSFDFRTRMLAVFTENVIVGRYLLPEYNSVKQSSLRLCFYKANKNSFAGKIYSIDIWDCAQRWDALFAANGKMQTEKQKKSAKHSLPQAALDAVESVETTPQTTVSAAEIMKNAGRIPRRSRMNIEERLEFCRARLKAVEKADDNVYKKDTLNFITKQINELQRQKKIKEMVQQAKRQNYSTEKTQHFVEEMQMYCYSRGNRPWSDEERMTMQKSLLITLNDPAVNPNVYLSGRAGGDDRTFVVDAINSAFSRNAMTFVLIRKKVDVNLCDVSKRTAAFPHQLMMFGVDDVDSGRVVPVMNISGYKYYLDTDFSVAKVFRNSEELLMLAPVLNKVNSEGENLMHLAAKYDNADFAQKLLYAGFTEFTARDKKGRSPWDVAIDRGSGKVAGFLLNNKFNTTQVTHRMGQIKLFEAIKQGDYDAVQHLLSSNAADPHIVGYLDMDALTFACWCSDLKMVSTIASNMKTMKYDRPDMFSNSSFNPFYIALLKKDMALCKTLFKLGVDAKITAIWQTNSFYDCIEHLCSMKLLDEKSAAAFIKTQVLMDKNFNINAKQDNWTLFSRVCRSARLSSDDIKVDLLKFLIKNGAQLSNSDAECAAKYPELKPLLNNKGIFERLFR